MGRFEGFYIGDKVAEQDVNLSGTELFASRRDTKETGQVSSRQTKIWKTDFDKCCSISDYQNYVKKYDNPKNSCIKDAKQKIDDMTFATCKSIEQYRTYLSSFPSGRNVIRANSAIRMLQSGTTTNTYTANSSNISGKYVWGFAKKAIGVIVILIGIGLIYARISNQITRTSAVAGFCVMILGPVCKWAFDN